MKNNKITRNFRIELDLWYQFKATAERNGTTLSKALRSLIKEYVDYYKPTITKENIVATLSEQMKARQETFNNSGVEIVEEDELVFPTVIEN